MLAKERAVDEDFPLTSRAIADSERAARGGDYDLDDDEPELGNRLLHEFAAEGLVEEVAPGRYWATKLRGEMPSDRKLS